MTHFIEYYPAKAKNLDFKSRMSVFIFIGFTSYSFFCMPWLLMIALFKLNPIIYYFWFINTVFSLIYILSSAIYIKRHGKFFTNSWVVTILWPFYFFLHSIAAYCALVEIVVAPFRWNKTDHGVSEDMELNKEILDEQSWRLKNLNQ